MIKDFPDGVAVDLGTGDGRFVARAAAARPDRLFLGVDAAHAPLIETSQRALRGRTAVPNAKFVLAAAESLPLELSGVATEVTVLLPWGSLLRAVAVPDGGLLAAIRGLCRERAALTVVVSAGCRDAGELARLGLDGIDLCARREAIIAGYRDAGFEVETIDELPAEALPELGTTWGKRLSRDADRRAWRLRARAMG